MCGTPPHEGRIEPTRARQKRSVATKLIAARTWLLVVLAPAHASARCPIAMDEEASWRRLGAQVLWYRRDNLASNLKLLAVTQLVRNRIRAA